MVNSKSYADLVLSIMSMGYLFQLREIRGGVGILVLFPNGYGADIVCHPLSYGWECGEWEVAVVTPIGYGGAFEIVYDTPITDDVIGYCDEIEVLNILKAIEELPTRPEA